MTVSPLPTADLAVVADDRRAVLAGVVERVLGDYAARPTISVEELSEVLAVGRSSAYELCRAGRVPTIRVGRSVRVPTPALAALLLGVDP
jgi:excisionase family DNA binding protein